MSEASTKSLTRCIGYCDASKLLSIPVGTLRSMVCRKQIPHVRISARIVVFEIDALAKWLQERVVPVANENAGSYVRPATPLTSWS